MSFLCPVHKIEMTESIHTNTSVICQKCKDAGDSGIYDKRDLQNNCLNNNLKTRVVLPMHIILDNFDFNKVHNVMTFLNWTYANGKVPSIAELKKIAEDLLYRSAQECFSGKAEFVIETGGWIAQSFYDSETNEINSRLLFSIADFENLF